MELNNRLVLGTVQLGLSYGIANKTGLPDLDTATAIVQAAWQGGIREFDTAQGYGRSEQVLAQVFSKIGVIQEARIITKLDPNLDYLNEKALRQALKKSLNCLKISHLHGLLLHREEFIDLLESDLKKILLSFIQDGYVDHIGVSVYSPEKAIQALQSDIIGMVQVPTNILDRRFQEAGVFELAEQKNKTIYIRSVFLQGLLLMTPEELPANMEFTRGALDSFGQLSHKFDMTRQEVALGYVKLRFPNAYVIFGAETPEQVKSNIASWAIDPPKSLLIKAEEVFGNVDERVINPILWPN